MTQYLLTKLVTQDKRWYSYLFNSCSLMVQVGRQRNYKIKIEYCSGYRVRGEHKKRKGDWILVRQGQFKEMITSTAMLGKRCLIYTVIPLNASWELDFLINLLAL